MRHYLQLFLIPALLAAFLVSCGFNTSPTYTDSDLIGRWQAPSESDIDPDGNYQYCVFLAEKDSTGEYRYGYMWDMGDHSDWDDSEGSYEDFMLTEDFHGNGWFKWKLSSSKLVEFHFMSGGWSDVPKSYTISVLTSTTLTYQDDFKKQHSWTRVR
ncbi:MAG: hypothetical protein IJS05_09010 [Paludibacteraceae bacterium]|nr:hypothetical protein [Paludibacteraceae bacterium]